MRDYLPMMVTGLVTQNKDLTSSPSFLLQQNASTLSKTCGVQEA